MSYRSGWALFWGFSWRFAVSAGATGALCAAVLATKLGAYDRQQEARREARLQLVTDGSRELTRGFSADVERIRTRALGWHAATNAAAIPQTSGSLGEGILHWAELYADDTHILGVRRSLPGTAALSSSQESYYLIHAQAKLGEDLARIRREKIALLRLEDPSVPERERLVFAFPLPAPDTNLVLAMIDPETAFPALSSWHPSSRLRMYLADRDGKVLLHTERNYVGAVISDAEAYRRLSARAQGPESVVIAKAASSDALTVTAAAARPMSLPLLLAVEQPVPMEESTGWLGISPRHGLYVFWVGIALIGALICAIGTVFWMWLWPSPAKKQAPDPEIKIETDPTSEPLAAAEATPAAPTPAGDPKRGDYPEVFEAALVESEFRQRLLSEGPLESDSTPEPETRTLSPDALAQVEARERQFIEEQLMDHYEDALIHERDPRKIGYLLTEFAQRLCEAPSAFFGFHSGLRSAILLQACALPPQSRRLVSFPLSDAVLSEIARAEKEGRVAQLDSYLPIKDMLKLVYRVSDFRAWALTGISRVGEGSSNHPHSLLGILVVFRGALEPGQLIERAIRSTGPLYEKHLHHQEAPHA